MRIALTGTPGVGKTTLGALLRERGEHVVDLKRWAHEAGAMGLPDADGTLPIDVDALDVTDVPSDAFIEGHLSHLLAVDATWIVRCDPAVLRGRLTARGYAPAKVTENLEAEAMDLLLQEALASGIPVVQRDGTRRSPTDLLAAFDAVGTGTLKGNDLEAVDWSDRLLEGL